MTIRPSSDGHFDLKANKSSLQMSSNICLKLQLTENVEQETQEANLLMALMETKLEHKRDIDLHIT